MVDKITAKLSNIEKSEYEIYFDGKLFCNIDVNHFDTFQRMQKLPITIIKDELTKQDLISKLNAIEKDRGDTEKNHCIADDLLIEYINDAEIETAYNKIDKWYA